MSTSSLPNLAIDENNGKWQIVHDYIHPKMERTMNSLKVPSFTPPGLVKCLQISPSSIPLDLLPINTFIIPNPHRFLS